jgi:very-short-patch-repair endonuclease
VDLATVLSTLDLTGVLEDALARGLVKPAQIRRSLDLAGRAGRKGTRSLARLLDERPSSRRPLDSSFESRLYRLLIKYRIPAPVPQYRVSLSSGRFAYIDFAYPHAMLALEVDGYRYHSSLSAWSWDRGRNNELVALGWRILPITPHDIVRQPARVADQVARALAASLKGSVD